MKTKIRIIDNGAMSIDEVKLAEKNTLKIFKKSGILPRRYDAILSDEPEYHMIVRTVCHEISERYFYHPKRLFWIIETIRGKKEYASKNERFLDLWPTASRFTLKRKYIKFTIWEESEDD